MKQKQRKINTYLFFSLCLKNTPNYDLSHVGIRKYGRSR